MLIYLLSVADNDKKQDVIYYFNRYHNELMSVAYSRIKRAGVLNCEYEAEDAVQNTFLKMTKYINTIKNRIPDESMRAYLYTMLSNEISTQLADYYKVQILSEDSCEIISDEDFLEELLIKERYNRVVCAIKTLDDKYSTVLLYRYCSEMTVDQISKMLGINKNTVYTRLLRAKKKLLETLEKSGEEVV